MKPYQQGGLVRIQTFKRHLCAGGAFIALSAAAAYPALARVEVTPRITARATWTDNVNLDRAGRESDVVLSAEPGLNIEANSNRLNGTIDYAPTVLVFLDNTSETDVRQYLSANMTGEVLRETMFVDFGGAIGQRFASLDGPVTSSEFNFSTNRRTVQNYFVRPRLTRDFGSFAEASANYIFSYSDIGNPSGVQDRFSNSSRHGGSVVINSGSAFNRLGWSLRGEYDNVERRRIAARFEDYLARGEVSLALSRQLTLLASGGYEKTEDATLADRNGAVWDAGFRWRPGPRTDLSFRGGRRFGSETFTGSLSYQLSEESSIRASYVDEIDIDNRLFNSRLIGSDIGQGGIPVDSNGVPLPVFGDDISLTDNAFRRRAASLSMAYGQRRINYSLRGFFERRTFDVAIPDEEVYGGTGGVAYNMGRGQSVSVDANYRRTKFDDGRRNDFWGVGARYEARINASASAFVSARHSTSSNRFRQDFGSNSVSVGVTATF